MNTKAEGAKPKAKAAAPKPAADGSVDIPLNRELEIDGTKVKALRMREPLVSDQMAAEEIGGGNAGKTELALIANLCMVSADDLTRLTLRDYGRLQSVLTGFIV